MKIEKINENQIKCTLNKSDLASRQIKASELAYGTEKAKLLFRDMMQQAATEFGFHAEDFPLMIEAIPTPGESIILIITKVEDPEELDTRFSNFSPDDSLEEEYEEDNEEDYLEDMEDIIDETPDNTSNLIDMFHQVKDKLEASSAGRDFVPLADIIDAAKKKNAAENAGKEPERNVIRVFSFDNLNTLIQTSGYVTGIYHGHSSLFKSTENNRYYLIMDKSSHTMPEFAAICNVISEFGTVESSSPVSEAYYKEHFDKIISRSALQKLQLINTGGFQNGSDH